jgi:hypothetical protein
MAQLDSYADYVLALLQVMAQLGSASPAEVKAAFEQQFGEQIAPRHRETNASGRLKWHTQIEWGRLDLITQGIMGSGGRGVWTITDYGRQWLSEHPDGGIDEFLARRKTIWKGPQEPAGDENAFQWQGRSWVVDREALIAQVQAHQVSGLPEEATRYRDWYINLDGAEISPKWLFHLVTGAGYNEFDSPTARRMLAKVGFSSVQAAQPRPHPQRVSTSRAARSRPLASGEKQPIYQLLDEQIATIRHFLAGRNVHQPSHEQLCDWVQFCYQFHLYTEGSHLFELINAESLNNDWLYGRTKKYAQICRLNANRKS